MPLPAWMGGAHRGAELSPDPLYRYVLWRIWDASLPLLGVVMLNPSTADADKDDATIRVVMGRARLAGYGGIVAGNLYAYRATSPADMWRAADGGDIVGPLNDASLERLAEAAEDVWVAWGGHAEPERAAAVVHLLTAQLGRRLLHVGRTRCGMPKHPLRIPYAVPFQVYEHAPASGEPVEA